MQPYLYMRHWYFFCGLFIQLCDALIKSSIIHNWSSTELEESPHHLIRLKKNNEEWKLGSKGKEENWKARNTGLPKALWNDAYAFWDEYFFSSLFSYVVTIMKYILKLENVWHIPLTNEFPDTLGCAGKQTHVVHRKWLDRCYWAPGKFG